MKKFLSAALIVLVITFSANICAAYDYDNDPDYVFVTTGSGGVFYLYLPSVDVQEYNPPHYQIAGLLAWEGIGGYDEWEVAIRYNWYTKETFNRDKNGYWQKDTVSPDCMATMRIRNIADALFRAAYGMDFYGY